VSATGSNTPANHFGGSFGPNEWLVDEMYEKYLADPNSVDTAWVEFFADYKPNTNGTVAQSNGKVIPTLDNAPLGGTPPLPKKVVDPAALQIPVAATQVSATPVAPVAPVAQATPATPVAPAKAATPADPINKPIPTLVSPGASTLEPIRGVSARVVQSMEASLTVPTATSVRAIPAKLMIDNRTVINNHLKRSRGGKVSFTHIIGYAMISAMRQMPEMNAFFGELDGKPAIGKPEHINLGIAIDLAKPDGSRQLLVPSIKGCEELDFAQFWASYEETVRKARGGSLTVEDFAGTTVSLTNPGTIGTVHSVPRLVQGQGLILGVGAMDYPAEFLGANEDTLADLAISKVVTLTSTYDHRIIQGAQSGDFLKRIHELLLGENGFYDEIFAALRIPYVPIRWVVDMRFSKEDQVGKTARVQELIQAYRTTGHLMADIDPLRYVQRSHPDLANLQLVALVASQL